MNSVAAAPGFLSLLPPLTAIVLAVWTRHVVLSLFVGLWIGVTILAGWNPLSGLRDLVFVYAWQQLSSPWNLSILLLMLCIGGFVELIVRSGSAAAFAESMSRFVTSRKRAEGAVWFSGIAVFFSDSANPLILGPLFGPLFDRLRIARAKLAYLIDSTASPICILVPITSWAAYVLSLIAREYANLGVSDSPMSAYLSSIPLQFYPIASLLLVPMVAVLGLEYGPMRKAQALASETTTLKADQPGVATSANDTGASTGIIALVTVAVVTIGVLLVSGGFPDKGILASLAAGKSIVAVTAGFVAGALMLLALLVRRRSMTLTAYLSGWGVGAANMREVLVILVLAWSLGACCDALGTGSYVAGFVERSVSPLFVPALVFAVGAIISFATGSAWGCFAIMMPIVFPIAVLLDIPIPVILAAVLSGGVFGDHASPISDTTILSSMGSGCDHVEHVRTQLPYAATAATVAILGFVLLGAWPSAWVLPVVVVTLAGIALTVNRLAAD